MIVTTGGRRNRSVGFFGDLDILHRLFLVSDGGSGGAEFARNIGGEFRVESLVDGGEDAAVHQLLDDEVGLHVELFGKLLDRDAFGNRDVAIDGRRRGEFAARLRPKIPFFGFALAIAPTAARGSAGCIADGARPDRAAEAARRDQ